jgi:hypothetical protein
VTARLLRLVALCALLLAGGATAHAKDSAKERLAKSHFVTGMELYKQGKFTEAGREFAAGYAIVPKREFLGASLTILEADYRTTLERRLRTR